MLKFPISIRWKNKSPLLIGMLVFLLITAKENAISNTLINPVDTSPSRFAEFLYQKNLTYRSTSEILRLKFEYGTDYDAPDLDILLLKSAYRGGDHQQVISWANSLLRDTGRIKSHDSERIISQLLSASYIATSKYHEAMEIWNTHYADYEEEKLLPSEQLPGRVDPEKARLYSSFFPGSGLLLTGNYGRATVSFMLNMVSLYGIYYFGSRDQLGIAGLLLFFEISWYSGGKNASYEAAVIHNRKLEDDYYKSRVLSNLEL